MAKPNQKQKRKKNNNGYFQRNIQQNGPDFLFRKTAKDIRYDFRNIIKDIAYSDQEQIPGIVEYFTNLTFITNLIESANQEFQKTNATFLGLQMYIAAGQRGEVYLDPNSGLYEQMSLAQNQSMAYAITVAHLNNILSLFNISVDDNWLRCNIENQLKSLSLQLSKYKRLL